MKRTTLFAGLLLSIFAFGFSINQNFVKSTTPFNNQLKLSEDIYKIVVDKSDFELKVYDSEGWYETYPIVFGSKDLGDKMREGDRKTPNGTYTIIQKKHNPKWGAQLLLDYPTQENKIQFNQRVREGIIPKNSKIGGGIAIHGTRPEEEWTVDYYQNWTDGCVSLKYSEMQDLYAYIPVGTIVVIQP